MDLQQAVQIDDKFFKLDKCCFKEIVILDFCFSSWTLVLSFSSKGSVSNEKIFFKTLRIQKKH